MFEQQQQGNFFFSPYTVCCTVHTQPPLTWPRWLFFLFVHISRSSFETTKNREGLLSKILLLRTRAALRKKLRTYLTNRFEY